LARGLGDATGILAPVSTSCWRIEDLDALPSRRPLTAREVSVRSGLPLPLMLPLIPRVSAPLDDRLGTGDITRDVYTERSVVQAQIAKLLFDSNLRLSLIRGSLVELADDTLEDLWLLRDKLAAQVSQARPAPAKTHWALVAVILVILLAAVAAGLLIGWAIP
jgi:hypothetical protein